MRKLHMFGVALAALFAIPAHAAQSQVNATGFTLTAFGSDGAVDPSVATFGGFDYDGTAITYSPPCCAAPGPGNPYASAAGPFYGASWNTNMLAMGFVASSCCSPSYQQYFQASIYQAADGLALSASALSNYGFQDMSYAGQMGTFTLAPHSSLLLSTTVSIAGDGYATFSLGLDGGVSQGWGSFAAQSGTSVSLTVTNTSDVIESGYFLTKVVASTTPVPEPDESALLVGGLLALGALAMRRQTA